MTETAVTQTAPLPGQEAAPLLQARGVGKRYPGVVALDDVSLTLTRGTVHALLGENGAGKSTLIRILSGIATPDSGELFVDGQPVRLGSASAAQDLGIATIHQEQSLAPDLTVLQNIFLGRELRQSGRGRWLLDERAMRKRVSGLCEEFGLSREYLDRPAGELGALKQHVVQILKALAFDTRAVILDEPTSGLADHERLSLFDHMRSLRDRGVALLWVTHRLDELFGLADVVTVLRDGRHVATVDPAEQTPESLIRLMVGRAVSPAAAAAPSSSGPERRAATEEVLRLEGVSRRGVLHDIDLAVRSGEVLGIAGIAGAGRTELARVILGADKIDSGEISVRGQVVKIRNPRDAYRLGIALVPEERKTQAILGDFSLIKNISISDLRRTSRARAWIDRRKERTAARNYVQDLGVKTSGVTEKIRNLSGGNQQKVIIARCLFTQPSLLIFDEPTQGIDVAAKAEVYRLIYEFVDAGGAAVVISSELPELISVSDRIAVMREGRIAGELPGAPRGAQLREEDKFAESIMALAAREVAS